MSNKDRLIFVTNDDGFAAPGFQVALDIAREFGRVVAIAPATTQSGRSQAITIYDPLFLEEVRREEGLEVYSLTGTPVDCVKLAFDYMLADEKVDLVISGVNHGSNGGVNVLYSGTMGAAIEGSFYGCPSVGLSLTDHSTDADFTAAREYGRRIVASILEGSEEERRNLCLNVNVPNIPAQDIQGIKVCRQCRGVWHEDFYRHEDPRGKAYFWLKGGFCNNEPASEDTDEWALLNGYVAVVPVQVDMTDYGRMPFLQSALK
ncbi:MAG: 5'/3'-nucleotidase SurE [Alistipes sp.]|nr:5'/3'-nucleotidase SurE [Alistipes sp.]